MEKWQAKIRCLRQNLMEWAKNMSVTFKKQKNELLITLDNLDKKVEHTLLSPQKIDMKQCFLNRLAELI
jgi:hypothetical protein